MATAATDGSAGGWAAFRYPDFVRYVAGRFCSALAIQVQNIGVGWLVYDLTNDPLALGLVGLAVFMPAVCLALVTGHVADRFDRRLILVVCYGLTTCVAAGLALHSWIGSTTVWPIYALLVLFGTARAFANPAGQALIPNLVPAEHFPNAVAWNSTAFQTATVAGPALGGILYVLGSTTVFVTATLFLAVTTLLMASIRRRDRSGRHTKATWSNLVAGIVFIRSRPAILGAISLDLFAVLLGGATALLPIYARDILLVGPWGLGLLRSMPAAGAVCMALYLANRPLQRHSGRRMLQAVAVFGLATIAFGLSTSLPLSLACLFVLGASDMISVYVRQTLVQLDTPDAMRGRVAAVNAVFIGASNELGEFESGLLASLVGAVGAVVLGGVGTLGVAGLWTWAFPALRDRDRLVEPRG